MSINQSNSLSAEFLPGTAADTPGGGASSPGTYEREGADFHFGLGLDTADIARLRWQREAQVLRELNIQRSERLGLPTPYPREDRRPGA